MLIKKLQEQQNVIEQELNRIETDLENIGILAIKIQKFIKNVETLQETNEDIKILKKKAIEFNKRIIELSNFRMKKRQQENEEMINSKLQPQQPYTECSTVMDDTTYFRERTHNVNNILTNAIDVLDTVKRQGKYIDNTSYRIRSGLMKIGLSRDLVNEIDKRYMADNRIFITGFIIILVLFVLLRFWFK